MTPAFAKIQFLFLLPIFLSGRPQVGHGGEIAQDRYSSPTAVFSAYREASRRKDWRKLFACLTPEKQNDLIFECFFACAEKNSTEARAIVKSHIDVRGEQGL